MSPEDVDEYEEMDEIIKAKCVDTRVVERNWEKNKYFVQSLRMYSKSILIFIHTYYSLYFRGSFSIGA